MISSIRAQILSVFVSFFFLLPIASFGQAGTEFWLTIPELTATHGINWGNGGIEKHIVVSTLSSPATVTVSVPADPSFDPIKIDVPPNTTQRFNFEEYNDLLEMIDYDSVTKQGILVESSDVITAYLESVEVYNPDVFTLKGRHALGKDFYVPMQNDLPSYEFSGGIQSYNSIDIVATEDNTIVKIVPSKAVAKRNATSLDTCYKAGDTITVTLNRGETYSARSFGFKATDHLGGTHIIANRPISVSMKDDSVLSQMGGYDLIGDQIVPVNRTGSQYIVMNSGLCQTEYGSNGVRAKEFAYIVPTQDGTKISVDGTEYGTYNAGENIGIPVTGDYTVISSDGEPFYCFHTVDAEGTEIGGALLPPTDQCSGSTQVGFSYSHGEVGQELFILIMVRTGAESAFSVDGTTASWLDPTKFQAISTASGWSAAKFGPLNSTDIEIGPHLITNSKDLFHVGYINTTGSGVLYGYFSDFESQEVGALAVKSNEKTATYCTGEDIQLRVDGGVNYSWKGFLSSDPSVDKSEFIQNPTAYNPLVKALPVGSYSFVVQVGNACGAASVHDTVSIDIISRPAEQTVTAEFCESEIGSECATEIDLTSYLTDLVGTEKNLSPKEWTKEVFDDMQILQDFDGEKHLSVTSTKISGLEPNADNPKKDGINASNKVLHYSTNGNAGEIKLTPKFGYSFDFSTGDIVTLQVYNDRGTNTCNERKFTLYFFNEGKDDTIAVTQTLKDCNKWVELTFDYTSFATDKKYAQALLTNQVDWETYEYYIDDIRKFVDYRVDVIDDPANVLLCDAPTVAVTLENDVGCQIVSTLQAQIKPGDFAINSPASAVVCADPTASTDAGEIDLTEYEDGLIGASGVTAGYTVEKWSGTIFGQEQILDDFTNNRNVTWTGSWAGNIAQTENPNSNDLNESKHVGVCPGGDFTMGFPDPISIDEGFVFALDICYKYGTDGNGEIKFGFQLIDDEGNLLDPAEGVQAVRDDEQLTWRHLEFDFSAYAGTEGIRKAQLTASKDWTTEDIYIDNLVRKLEPFSDEITDPTVALTRNGDTFYAVVKNDKGCKVLGELNVALKACGPPVTDTTIVVCEDKRGEKTAGGLDISLYGDVVKSHIAESLVEWFDDSLLTNPIADPTAVTAVGIDTLYAKVTSKASLSDTAKLIVKVQSLPVLTFPKFDSYCVKDTSIAINTADPAGGIYTSESTFFHDDTLLTISEPDVYMLRYTYTDSIGCVDSVDQEITVNPLPNIKLLTSDFIYCSVSDVNLEIDDEPGAGYAWYIDGALMTSETSNVVNGAISGTYAVEKTVNGCTATKDSIVVKGYGTPPYFYHGADTICEGSGSIAELSIEITGLAPWSLKYTDHTGTAQSITVKESPYKIPFSETAQGLYTFTVSEIIDSVGCPADIRAESLNFLIRPPASSPWVTGADTSICVNENAVDLSSYVSVTGGIFSGAGISGDNFDPQVAGDGVATVYYQFEDANECSALDSLKMDVHALPVPVFPFATSVCITDVATPLTIATNDSITSGSFSGDGVSSNQFDPQVAGDGAHDILYSFESIHSCNAESKTSITVHKLPDTKIETGNASYCISDEAFAVPVSPAGGILSGTGISGTNFDPSDAGKGNFEIEYYVKDKFGCEQTDKATFTVLFTEPIESKHFTFVESAIASKISVSAITGAEVHWYETETSPTAINVGAEFIHGQTAIVEKSYWVSQIVDNCESERTEIKLSIIDCGTPAPIIADPKRTVCLYSPAEVFTAQTVTVDAEVRWYDSNDKLVHTGKTYTANATDNFKFYAVQDTGCQSAAADAELLFTKPVKPVLSYDGDICEGAGYVTVNENTGSANTYWFSSDPGYPADIMTAEGSGNPFSAPQTVAGTHSLWAANELDGCISKPTKVLFTIKEVPTTVTANPKMTCFGQDVNALKTTGTMVKWYDQETATVPVAESETFSPTVTEIGFYTYWVSQTVGGCESQRVAVGYEIRKLPKKPRVQSDTICSNFPYPTVTAQADYADVYWYKTPTSKLRYVTGPTITLDGKEKRLYVSQYGDGCESNRAMYELTVIQQPDRLTDPQTGISLLDGETVCEGSSSATLSASVTVEWFLDTLQSALSDSKTLTIQPLPNNSTYYFARQETDGCYSYFDSVLLEIIPQPGVPSVARPDFESCEEDVETFIASADGGNTLHWFDATGNEVETGSEFKPTGLLANDQTIAFSVKQADGVCFSEPVALSYYQHGLPAKPIFSNTEFCFGDKNMQVVAISNDAVNWLDSDTEEIIAQGRTYDIAEMVNAPGNYNIFARAENDFGCFSKTVAKVITVGAVPNPSIIGPSTVCTFAPDAIYEIENAMEQSTFEWRTERLEDLEGSEKKRDTVMIVYWDVAGDDVITVEETSILGCVGKGEYNVSVAPTPVADFGYTFDNDIVKFRNTSKVSESGKLPLGYTKNLTSIWNFGREMDIDTTIEFSEFHKSIERYYDYGQFDVSLWVENEYGCIDSITKNIFVELVGRLYAPSAFAPEHQAGTVQLFKPFGMNIESFEIYVYDAWGNIVWFSDKLDHGQPAEEWDGRVNGALMAPGSYVWKMKATFKDGSEWKGYKKENGRYTKYGHVVLIR